jgi:Bax protein
MTYFERCAVALLGAMVVVLIGTATHKPLDIRTAAPQATFLDPASAPIPPRYEFDAFGINDPTAAVPQTQPEQPQDTVATVFNTFAEMGYDLDSVLSGRDPVPRLILARMPAGLEDVAEVKVRKAVFVQTVLPLVLKVNEEILKDRQRLWKIRVAKASGRKLDALDRLWIAVASDRYKVGRGDLDALLARIDIVPPSIALAQAAEESGWGTSRFAREGNAIFGQWTYSRSRGLLPRERAEGKTHRIRTFDNLLESVRAYALNLNTHSAYREFRRVRASLRGEGRSLTGMPLLPTLTAYSERGGDYLRNLYQIMTINDLVRADDVHLRDHDDTGLQVAGDDPAAPQHTQTAEGDGTI